MMQDHTAQRILERLSELKHGPQEEAEEALTPYEEFESTIRGTTSPLGVFSTAGSQEPKRWEASSAATSLGRLGDTGPASTSRSFSSPTTTIGPGSYRGASRSVVPLRLSCPHREAFSCLGLLASW